MIYHHVHDKPQDPTSAYKFKKAGYAPELAMVKEKHKGLNS
jgi:hypothetical protein